MALACQKNSYLDKLSTCVKSCDASRLVISKKEKIEGYDVILEDTVLFPEGGGQPDDRGMINDLPVLRVTRRGAEAVHFVLKPLEVGQEVTLEVDWSRRWDHMQQHSGQHLITALADEMFNFPTTSWNLGEQTSFIELDTAAMSPEQMQSLEEVVNRKIREGVRMFPTLYSSIHDPELLKVRTRGLPEDHEGPVRVVTIEGIESNMCCGTHVSTMSHLQAVKLLSIEKGKKGKVNLTFVVGDRVLKLLSQCYDREKTLTTILKGNPNQHADLAEKMQKSLKETKKNELNLLRDLAKVEAQRFMLVKDGKKVFSLHRKEGDIEFMNIVANEVNSQEIVLFLTTGDERGQGMFMLCGPEDFLTDYSSKVLELLEGKGAVKHGRLQGKANKLLKRADIEKLLEEYETTCKMKETVI